MEDFESNELFEENNEIETMKRDAAVKEAIYDLKVRLANENYNMIVKNGIDIESMRNNNYKIEALKETLNEMLLIFVELEQYEKCAKVRDILEQI